MSFKCMGWASEQKTGSGTRKLVLLMLADRAGDNNKCYPSINKLSEDCELSRDTVIRATKQLEEYGHIEIIHRSKDGSKLSNIYKLNVQGVVAEKVLGSSTKQHKPINEPYSTFFEKLWSDYSVFGKRKNFMVGNKSKAWSSYQKLVKKMTDNEIYKLVELEVDKEYAWRHLVTILNEKLKDIK